MLKSHNMSSSYRMYDVDGNGVIDQDEMTKIVQVQKNAFVEIHQTDLPLHSECPNEAYLLVIFLTSSCIA